MARSLSGQHSGLEVAAAAAVAASIEQVDGSREDAGRALVKQSTYLLAD